MLHRLKSIAIVLITILIFWALTHGLLIFKITDVVPILGSHKGYITGIIEDHFLEPMSNYVFLIIASTLFFFLSYPIFSYILRLLPLDASGRRRNGVIILLAIGILISVGLLVRVFIDDFFKPVPCELKGGFFSSITEHGSYVVISFLVNIIWILGILAYTHANSSSILSEVNVLFLRKFHSHSDKAVLRVLNSCLPTGVYPTFLLPPKSESVDWDPSSIIVLKGFYLPLMRRFPVFIKVFDTNWVEQIECFMKRAKCIILDVSCPSESLGLEIEISRKVEAENKTVIICDRDRKDEAVESFIRENNIAKKAEYSARWRYGILRTLSISFIYIALIGVAVFLLVTATEMVLFNFLLALILIFIILLFAPTIIQPSVNKKDSKIIKNIISGLTGHSRKNRIQIFKSSVVVVSIYISVATVFGIILYPISVKSLPEAVEVSSLYYTKKYLKEGQSPTTLDRCGRPMISLAIIKENVDILNELLRAGGDPNQVYQLPPSLLGEKNSFPLMDTIKRDKSLASALLEFGANPNQTVSVGFLSEELYTPLIQAIIDDDATIFNLLLTHGADPNIGNPLIHAIESKNNKFIKPLLDAGCNPNKVYVEGFFNVTYQTPLALAVSKNDDRTAKLLLEYGADPNIVSFKESNYVHILEIAKDPKVIAILQKYGASLKIRKKPNSA